MKTFALLLLIHLTVFAFKSDAQNQFKDSIISLIKNDKNDTLKVIHINALAWELMYSNPDTSIILTKKANSIAKKINWKSGLANGLGQLGSYYYLKGDYSKSLHYHFKALEMNEKIKSKKGIGRCYSNIGIVYYSQKNYDRALDYYFKALKIDEFLNDKYGKATELGNIGVVYKKKGEVDKAIQYYSQALKIDEEIGDKNGVSIQLMNIGIIYMNLKKYEAAISNYNKALEIDFEIGDKNGLAVDYGNFGSLYLEMKDYSNAEKYYKLALDLNKELGSKEGLYIQYENLSSLYDSTKNYAKALKNYQLFILYRDSLANEENTKKQTQIEMQYEFDKKQTADSVQNSERTKQEQLKHRQEIKQQQIYTYGGIGGFCLMLIVAIISFKAFRNKQRANLLIEEQKRLVEEKQKEIVDSIYYAKRIQIALLPSSKYIERSIKKINKSVLLLICLLLYNTSDGKNKEVDSLLQKVNVTIDDTNKIKCLLKLSDIYSYNRPDSALIFSTQSLRIAKKIRNKTFEANCLREMGWGNYMQGNYTASLNCYTNALEIDTKLKLTNRVVDDYGSIASVYYAKGNYTKSLDYFFKSLKICEQLKDKKRQAKMFINIAMVYANKGEITKALDYNLKALPITKKYGSTFEQINAILNIGVIYYELKNFSKALEYFKESLKKGEETGNKIFISASLGNIGNIYDAKKNYPMALEYFQKTLKIKEEIGDKKGIALWSNNIGGLYVLLGKYKEAEKNLEHGLEISLQMGNKVGLRDLYQNLTQLYDSLHNKTQAFYYYKKYILYRDSLQNDENVKRETALEMQFEFDKKEAADSLKNASKVRETKFKHQQEIQQQRIYTYGGMAGFAFMLIAAIISFRTFRTKRKANLLVEHQKIIVEKKQAEIIDSIRYAGRIQHALLPHDVTIEHELKRLQKK